MGCGLLFPVPWPPSVGTRVRPSRPLGTCSPVRAHGLFFVPFPGPLGSCSPVCLLGALCCMCAVLGHLAPVHRCARSVRCVACAVSWPTWLLFTGALTQCVVLCVRCPGPLSSCSRVCPLGVLCCVCGVMGHLAPFHLCAWSVGCVACAVSWATLQMFTGVLAQCVAFRVWCPGPLGSWSPVCPLGVLRCVCVVMGLMAPVHRCARSVHCVACAASCATWLLFARVPARSVVLCVRCPQPLGSCATVCPRILLRVRCPWRSSSCSLSALCCVCSVLGHLAPVHLCACSVRCVACAVFLTTSLLLTGVHAWRAVLLVRCPGPLSSWLPVCTLGVLCCVCRFLGDLAPFQVCVRSACCVVCAVSWAT